ncbi:MAG: Ig-like domain-containing protein [Burkholderiaceae bacterium]
MSAHSKFSTVFIYTWAVAALCAPNLPAQAQDPRCVVPPFSGASQPTGAVAQMRVINDGKACGVSHFGVPSEKRNPAEAAKVLHPAAHGKVQFVPPRVLYTPEPGFVGEDEFAYEARAKNNQDQPVVLKVKMKVIVLPAV